MIRKRLPYTPHSEHSGRFHLKIVDPCVSRIPLVSQMLAVVRPAVLAGSAEEVTQAAAPLVEKIEMLDRRLYRMEEKMERVEALLEKIDQKICICAIS